MDRRLLAGVLLPGALALTVLTIVVAAVGMASFGWGMTEHMQRMHDGEDTSDTPLVTGGVAETVDIRDFVFEPGNLRVPAGATVTWVNDDSAPHTATAKGGGDWDTGNLSEGESAAITFDEPGEYAYYCKLHPQMVARLVVDAAVN